MTENGYAWTGGDKLINTILEETGLQHAKCMSTPAARASAKQEVDAEELDADEKTRYRSSLGKLMYLADDHPDIEFAMNCLARRASKPTKIDEQRLRRVVRYLKGHRVVLWQYETDTTDFRAS